ncbi:MAG: FAD:protein transferase [Ilumatobacteraceae bacterium]|nr:FAD:protein transferase [Ilumatobacteraceae bacterium]
MNGQPTAQGWTLVAGYQPVMGTHLELQITASTEREARSAEAAAVAEATRLEGLFTVFDPASNLCRWRNGTVGATPELQDLLGLAARWQTATGGAFNPMSGILTQRWMRAVHEGTVPSPEELADLVAAIAQPPFAVRNGVVVRTASCAMLDLNAIAKGHVVDLVAQHVLANHDVSRLVINAGGDLVHRGAGAVGVAVEDPYHPYDNAPPIADLVLSDAAVATSGRSRRWFEVDCHRYSRVLDPRTGSPVSHTASATVVAPTAATADVLATAASVLSPDETLTLLARVDLHPHTASCLVIDDRGRQHPSEGWPASDTAQRTTSPHSASVASPASQPAGRSARPTEDSLA